MLVVLVLKYGVTYR